MVVLVMAAVAVIYLYSLLGVIGYSYPFLLILVFADRFRAFVRRNIVLNDKEVSRCLHRDIELKNDVNQGIDMISNLPCSIIHKILQHMPLHDIVRTSVLSREWRCKWKNCPELVFDLGFDQRFLQGHELGPVISDILSHHQGPLQKFVIQVPALGSCTEINNWIHLLPSDTLQDLNLRISIGGKHKLTSRLFNFRNLSRLELNTCAFDLPPGSVGLRKLTSLDFLNVGFMPERFGEFIAACPAITSLRLIHCTAFDCLNLTGPNIKSLEFVGVFRSVSFTNCPVLSDVRLTLSSLNFDNARGFSFDLVKSLSCLPMLEELHLQACALENLVMNGALEKLPIELTSLKILHLTDMYFETMTEMSCTLCFIRSCPILQRLKITAFSTEVVDIFSAAVFLRKQQTSASWNHLRFIKILRFGRTESEMEFAKHMLASASELEEMAISPCLDMDYDVVETILIKLKQFPRASPRVKFIKL